MPSGYLEPSVGKQFESHSSGRVLRIGVPQSSQEHVEFLIRDEFFNAARFNPSLQGLINLLEHQGLCHLGVLSYGKASAPRCKGHHPCSPHT